VGERAIRIGGDYDFSEIIVANFIEAQEKLFFS
jgi:hypothetical protein